MVESTTATSDEHHELAARTVLFDDVPIRGVAHLTPFRQNERLRIQLGTFLVPGDISTSFMENLSALNGSEDAGNVLKLIVSDRLRRKGLEQLHGMNISRRSLFPGIDGYAQSLGVYHPLFELNDR